MNADLLNLDSASCPRPSGRQVSAKITLMAFMGQLYKCEVVTVALLVFIGDLNKGLIFLPYPRINVLINKPDLSSTGFGSFKTKKTHNIRCTKYVQLYKHVPLSLSLNKLCYKMCINALHFFLSFCLQLWDIGGQPRFRSMWERYCRGVNCIV